MTDNTTNAFAPLSAGGFAPLAERQPTPWFPVSMDGWKPPVYSGWFEWRRINDGTIDRLWFNHKTGNVMAVCGHCPPLVWDAWRGLL